jgi:hypothetical protein
MKLFGSMGLLTVTALTFAFPSGAIAQDPPPPEAYTEPPKFTVSPQESSLFNSAFKPAGAVPVIENRRAAARLGKVTIKGPGRVKRNRTATYSITIRNVGGATATGVRLEVGPGNWFGFAGSGLKPGGKVANIAGKNQRVVKAKVRFKKKGRVKVTIRASSKNGGKSSTKKTITVR